ATSAPPVLAPADISPAAGTCAGHPNLPAVFVCRVCSALICDLCAFPQDDGSRLCPKCATVRSHEPVLRGGLSSVTLAVENRKCVQHPTVAAVQICHACGASMCATCDFLLPGNIHVCPTCATKPNTELSPKRKKMLIGSFALAVWCTLMAAALMGGVFRGFARNKADQEALGMLLMLLLLVPSIIGTALGVGARDRRLANTVAMWVAIVWNAVFLVGFILLMILGMFMKG
ncbi:MAG TPA: hypothetical protein VF988_15985, partial [Verrucomicrobiae bacterium]